VIIAGFMFWRLKVTLKKLLLSSAALPYWLSKLGYSATMPNFSREHPTRQEATLRKQASD
jgi:hypothetical protein